MTPDATAMLVFVDRRPVDGLARRGDRCVRGVEAIDEVADLPVEGVSVKEVEPEVARALGGYFEDTVVRDVRAAFVQPEPFIRSLGRPGRRVCTLIRGREQLGVAFLSGGVQDVRARLGRNAAPVEDVFVAAPPTREGLRQAAESVRSLQIRLVSPATLDEIADRARRALDQL